MAAHFNMKIRAVLIEFSFSRTLGIFSFNTEENIISNLEWYLNKMVLKENAYSVPYLVLETFVLCYLQFWKEIISKSLIVNFRVKN